MKRITSRFIFFSTLLLSIAAAAQENVLEKVTTRGLRIGIDGGHAIVHQVLPERRGWEVVSDYQLRRKWFVAGEFGYQSVDVDEESFEYDLSGGYLKLGVDYDVLKSVNTDDIVTVGLRYGTSVYRHQANDITLNNYWGNLTGSITDKQFNANWLELVFGVKAELFFLKNVFLGWSVRSGLYLWGEKDERMDALVIPGFGRGDSNIGITFNWTLSYRIPFTKEVIETKEK